MPTSDVKDDILVLQGKLNSDLPPKWSCQRVPHVVGQVNMPSDTAILALHDLTLF